MCDDLLGKVACIDIAILHIDVVIAVLIDMSGSLNYLVYRSAQPRQVVKQILSQEIKVLEYRHHGARFDNADLIRLATGRPELPVYFGDMPGKGAWLCR